MAAAIGYVAGLDPDARAEFLALADAHHVVIRALARIVSESGDLGAQTQWANGRHRR